MGIKRKINNQNVEETEIDSEDEGFEGIDILNLNSTT